MNILLITDAMAPLSGRSARAQVTGALPKALKSLDHQPYVLSPLYKNIDPKEHSLARRLTKLKHTFA
ncbi:MAG: glycogen synthase, partial [Polyangiales bacterium]